MRKVSEVVQAVMLELGEPRIVQGDLFTPEGLTDGDVSARVDRIGSVSASGPDRGPRVGANIAGPEGAVLPAVEDSDA